VIDLIGNTPMVELRAVRDAWPEGVRLYAEARRLQPGGSVKDRPAKRMIEQGHRGRKARRGEDDPRLDLRQHRHRASRWSAPRSAIR
jgi:cysteine synthase